VAVAVFAGARAIEAATELAKVNTTSISLEDFNQKYKENLKFFQLRVPTRQSVLDDLIKRELGIQEARKEGLDRDPEVIERMNTVLYHALLDKKLTKDFEAIHISDEDAKEFYGKNPEIRTSHIFVAVRPDAKAEDVKKAREKIDEAQRLVNDGKTSFAEIAQKNSEGVAAPNGGDIDYQTRDRLDPAYYEAALKLKSVGAVTSQPVRSQFGFHIIKLTGMRPWDDVDKASVKRMLFDERRAEIFEKYMKTLRAQAKVTEHKELLRD
jgi:peptidyl-prolyl cis-trans isomerase C/peptidyl-prolyl cis-trans isomerase D